MLGTVEGMKYGQNLYMVGGAPKAHEVAAKYGSLVFPFVH